MLTGHPFTTGSRRTSQAAEAMDRPLRGAAAILLLALAAPAWGEDAEGKSHARTLQGTVVAWDRQAHVLSVRDGRGTSSRLLLTSATRVSGGSLEAGASLTVRWVYRDRQKVATAILVHPTGTKSDEHSPSPAPSPASPTPGLH
jgi:hypothetical protein